MHTVETIGDVQEELVNGIRYILAAPTQQNQRITGFLFGRIWNYIHRTLPQGDCEILTAFCPVYLSEDDRTYIRPDLSVVCDLDKMDESGFHGAPDWVIEVVSDKSRYMDYTVKLSKYLAAGVREYWIVDEEKGRILVYRFEEERMEEFSCSGSIRSGIFDAFEIDFSML